MPFILRTFFLKILSTIWYIRSIDFKLFVLFFFWAQFSLGHVYQ